MQGASEMAASLAVLSAADKEQGTLIPCPADRRMCMVNVSRRDVWETVFTCRKMDASPAIAFQTTVVIVYEVWKRHIAGGRMMAMDNNKGSTSQNI